MTIQLRNYIDANDASFRSTVTIINNIAACETNAIYEVFLCVNKPADYSISLLTRLANDNFSIVHVV